MNVDLPNDANGDALRRLISHGSDLSRPIQIDFHVAVPSRQAGERFADAVSGRGFETELVHDEADDSWTCWCSRVLIAKHEEITRIEGQLDALGEPYGAYADGWGSFGNSGAG